MAVKVRPGIQLKITLLSFFAVLFALLVALLIVVGLVEGLVEGAASTNVLNLARAIATDPAVISAFGLPRPEEFLQPYAERVRLSSSGVDFITIMNMRGERYSHPNPANIGKRFVGGDEVRALTKGESYVSKAVGTLGLSLRAFVPVFDGGRQVGVVAVGTLLEGIRSAQWRAVRGLLLAFLLSALFGGVGSYLLARDIKGDIFGLEPYQIAKILEERSSILDAVVEGIVAVDELGRISLMNDAARRILSIEEDTPVLGRDVEELIPSSRLKLVLRSGVAEHDDESTVNGVQLVANRVPVVVDGEVRGAVATFRLKTDLEKLAEQLLGYRQLVDTLRAQAHEFMNHMHLVGGLISMGRSDEALRFIYEELGEQQSFAGQVIKCVLDRKLAALLLGKYSRAAELGVKLYLEEGSMILEDHGPIPSGELVTILGNLLENAIEAASASGRGGGVVGLRAMEREDYVFFRVYDNGPGMDDSILQRIFERGFSSKGEGRGMGLFAVKGLVDRRGGKLEVSSSPGRGTSFVVRLPKVVS